MNKCKYYKIEKYLSTDGGVTWISTGISERGALINDDSMDCNEYKFYATYSDSTTYSAECDSSSALTTATTRAHTTSYTAMTSAVIGNCVTSIGNEAFRYCSGLTSVTIPNSVTSIGTLAFYMCSGLTSIDIPSGVTTIGDNAFNNCRSLTSVIIQNSVTSIGKSVFTQCENLASVTLGSGVTTIGNGAFRLCSNLTSVTCLATTPPSMGTNVFYGVNCAIYVPSESVNAYKSASGWSTYADMIQAIQ